MTAPFESVMVKICAWLFFGVLVAALPVLIDAMAEMTRGLYLGGVLRTGQSYDGALVATGSLGVFAAAVGSGFFSTVWIARREAQHG